MAELQLKKQTQVCKSCGRELSIEMFRVSRLGMFKTCMDCTRQHQIRGKLAKKIAEQKAEDAKKERSLRLSDFTPRELMAELKRRGYEFTMEFVETHVIHSKDIEI